MTRRRTLNGQRLHEGILHDRRRRLPSPILTFTTRTRTGTVTTVRRTETVKRFLDRYDGTDNLDATTVPVGTVRKANARRTRDVNARTVPYVVVRTYVTDRPTGLTFRYRPSLVTVRTYVTDDRTGP